MRAPCGHIDDPGMAQQLCRQHRAPGGGRRAAENLGEDRVRHGSQVIQRPIFGRGGAAVLCRLQGRDIIGVMPQGQGCRPGAGAAAESAVGQPAQRARQVHHRRHTRDRQRMRLPIAGRTIDFGPDQQGANRSGQFRSGSIFEVIAAEVGLVTDPHVATTSPSGPISTLLKFQPGAKPYSFFSQA